MLFISTHSLTAKIKESLPAIDRNQYKNGKTNAHKR